MSASIRLPTVPSSTLAKPWSKQTLLFQGIAVFVLMVLAFDFFFLESTSTSKSSDKEKRPNLKRPNLHTGLDTTSSADSRPSYIGTECFPGSTYWDNPCLGGCLPNDTCTFWKTGKPQWLSQPLTRSVKWKVQKTETDYDYTLGKDGVNMLPANKRYHIFTQREAIECLKGRRLLISGDSMLRQLFIYTTYWFRGIQSPIESYFHVESHYTHRKDSDEIEIGPFMWPSREQDDEHGNLFHIAFVWSGTAFMKQSAVDLDVDVVVAGVNYWSDQVVEMGVVKDLYEFVDGRVKTWVDPSVRDTALYWFTTPPNGNHSRGVGDEGHMLRNGLIRGEIDAINKIVKKGYPIAFALPSDKFSMTGYYERNHVPQNEELWDKYDPHFMCGYYPEFPQQIKTYKMPANRDCRSLFNYNLVQVLLNSMCEVSVE